MKHWIIAGSRRWKTVSPGEKSGLVSRLHRPGTGRGYLSVGKPANLYPRLPLPGSTVSETGEYTISDTGLITISLNNDDGKKQSYG